jgi:hypothetical protein
LRAAARQRIAFAAANRNAISLTALTEAALAQRSAGFINYWRSHHAFPDTNGILGLTLWLRRALSAFCAYFWRAPGSIIILLIAAVGAVSFWHARLRAATLMLLAPILLAMAASFAHLWPFGGNQQVVHGAGHASHRRAGMRNHSLQAVAKTPMAWRDRPRRITWTRSDQYPIGALFPRRNSDLRSVVEFFQRRRLPRRRDRVG